MPRYSIGFPHNTKEMLDFVNLAKQIRREIDLKKRCTGGRWEVTDGSACYCRER